MTTGKRRLLLAGVLFAASAVGFAVLRSDTVRPAPAPVAETGVGQPYELDLSPMDPPVRILADYPDYVQPVRATRCFRAPALIQDPDADLDVMAWRYSYHARGILVVPNHLDGRRTALIVVHPWGIDDAQGWKLPQPAGVALFSTPAKNAVYRAHVRTVLQPFLADRRGDVGAVVISLPGPADPLRTGLYRSIAGPPPAADRQQARQRLRDRLQRFSYAGAALPETLPLSADRPRTRAFFEALPALDDRTYNPEGYWSLPIPVIDSLRLAEDDVVFYDGQGYPALRRFLRDRGIRHVLLAGYAADMCVKSTAAGYENLRRDFNVFLVGDATLATFPANRTPAYATHSALSAASQSVFITQISWIRPR